MSELSGFKFTVISFVLLLMIALVLILIITQSSEFLIVPTSV